jgi:hypothetical protein
LKRGGSNCGVHAGGRGENAHRSWAFRCKIYWQILRRPEMSTMHDATQLPRFSLDSMVWLMIREIGQKIRDGIASRIIPSANCWKESFGDGTRARDMPQMLFAGLL